LSRAKDQAVAITGMGMVTAQGVGVERSWRGVAGGIDGLRTWSGIAAEHPLARVKVAQCAEVPRPEDLPARFWRGLSRTQQLGCVAADEALGQAGLDGGPLGDRAALFLATTTCGMDINERFYAEYRQDKAAANVDLLRRIQPGEIAELLRRRYGIQAPGARNVCLSTCVGSAMAIASAMDAINLGECDLAVAGGSEALCRVVLSGFHALKVTAADGCRPFDARRPGMTVGEGAGIVVLERVRHARGRGAAVLGYLRGCGITCDAHHLTAPEFSGKYAAAAMRQALERAGMAPADIGYLNAHGTGTQANDAMEAAAIEAVFLEGAPPVSSTKRSTGHTFGAAGAVEAIFCVHAIREGMVPPNAGALEADGGLWKRGDPVARAARRCDISAAMSTNFAFGGNNTALILAREAGDE
jgi:3-oxoacyl-(acyl-carrier-protein) synthase